MKLTTSTYSLSAETARGHHGHEFLDRAEHGLDAEALPAGGELQPAQGWPPIDRVAEEVVPVADGALLLVDLLSASGLLEGIDAA